MTNKIPKLLILFLAIFLTHLFSSVQAQPSDCVNTLDYWDGITPTVSSNGGDIDVYIYDGHMGWSPDRYSVSAQVSYSTGTVNASCILFSSGITVKIPSLPANSKNNVTLTVFVNDKQGACQGAYFSKGFIQKAYLQAGSIGSNQSIIPGSQPKMLSNTVSASGYTSYQWQQSTNNSTWGNIAGATAATYQPPVLSATAYYRRAALYGGSLVYSNTVSISMIPGKYFTPSNENYIITSSPFHSLTSSQLSVRDSDKAIASIVYYDGLGRPMQEVSINGSLANSDLVRPVVYDAYGREEKTYLPYQRGGTLGIYTANTTAVSTQGTFHNTMHGSADGAYAYAQKQFEASPLNRVLKESAPGRDWNLTNGRPNSMVYSANAAGEVSLWSVAPATNVLGKSGTYAAAQLYVNEITDADGHKVREYKDKQGNVIEKRQVSPAGQSLVTSYVYDAYNRLRAVVPPKAQALAVNSVDFNRLVYRYNYDKYGRMTEKKLPDSDNVFMVYDNRDRPVMTQDGELRPANKWRVTLYDNLNRPVVEGIAITALTHANLCNYYDNAHVNQTRNGASYSLNSVSGVPALIAVNVLSYMYYDNYAGNALAYTAGHFNAPIPVVLAAPKAQLTWTNVKAIDGNEHTASAKWMVSATHYDNKYRPAQVRKHLYDGASNGTVSISSNFAFDGNPDKVREIQTFNGISTTVDMAYTYDHVRRPVDISMNGTIISKSTYDALGRSKTKTLGNSEAVNYAYNIRDWLSEIKSSKFETQLFYNTSPAAASVKPLFNGNIAAATWRHSGGAQQNYLYGYDGFGRLTQGVHSGNKSEKDISYDANGNITTLVRDAGNSSILYADAEFRTGMNGINVYNNVAGSGTVTVARLPKSADCPTSSTHYIKISNTGAASPGLGGFYWATPGSANRSMTVRITAKIPVGYAIQFHTNSIGTGSKIAWASSQAGTGKWDTYILTVKCGSTGTFGATNYFAISGGAYGTVAKPVDWYVGSATVYEHINENGYEYTYEGNQLKTLKKNGVSYNYVYDKNGNTTTDGLRGLNISYNVLNLPRSVTKGADMLEYIYSASGEKLAKKKNGQFVQFYCGSMVYTGAKVLEYVIHPEGLALKNGAAYDYQYNLTDHLGNTRTVLSATNATVQANDYYPFGLTHAPTVANLNKNKYLYNGKELQTEVLSGTAFEQLDYGARFYDPTIGRWHVIDRFAEKYVSLSPYNYAANNPINIIDINGDSIMATVTNNNAWIALQNIIGAGTAGQFRVFNQKTVGENKYILGITAATGGGDRGKMNTEELAFLDNMLAVFNGKGMADVTLVYNSPNVDVGMYDNGHIDMGDIEAFTSFGELLDRSKPSGATQQGKLTHEIVEQHYKGRMGDKHDGSRKNFKDAHSTAIRSENQVNGNIRGDRGENQYFKEKNGSTTHVNYIRRTTKMKVYQKNVK